MLGRLLGPDQPEVTCETCFDDMVSQQLVVFRALRVNQGVDARALGGGNDNTAKARQPGGGPLPAPTGGVRGADCP